MIVRSKEEKRFDGFFGLENSGYLRSRHRFRVAEVYPKSPQSVEKG